MRAALLLLVLASTVSAQPEWRRAPAGPVVSLDVLIALGDDFGGILDTRGNPIPDVEVGVVSSAFALGARVPVGGWTVVADLPLSYTQIDTPAIRALGIEASTEDDADLGNPYVGLEVQPRAGVTVGVGVRVPLSRYRGFVREGDDPENPRVEAPSFGYQGGYTADRDRFEAYLPETFSLTTSLEAEHARGPLRARVRVAPTFIRDFSDVVVSNDPPRSALALGYSALVEGGAGRLTLTGGLLGRPVVAGSRFGYYSADATLALGAALEVGRARPSVLVRVPVGDDALFFDPAAAVGFGLDVVLR